MKVMSSMKSVKFTYVQIHMYTCTHTNIWGSGTCPAQPQTKFTETHKAKFFTVVYFTICVKLLL